MSRAKKRLPPGMGELADEANERMLQRQSPPRIRIEKGRDGWRFSCPYAPEDEERWAALLADAFGTRSGGTLDHFLESICELVPEGDWNGEKKFWYPKESDFNAVLAIVSSLRPENEAQAAQAAQLAALHLSAMKLGSHATRYGDQRTVAVLAKTSRAFGDGIERLARIQGRIQPKTVNQTIQVVYVDQRDQRSVNLTGGGFPIWRPALRSHGKPGCSTPRAAKPMPGRDCAAAAQR